MMHKTSSGRLNSGECLSADSIDIRADTGGGSGDNFVAHLQRCMALRAYDYPTADKSVSVALLVQLNAHSPTT